MSQRTNRFFVTYRDFSGGMQELTSPLVVGDNESPFLSNIQLDKPGIFNKGMGYIEAGSGVASGKVKGIGILEKEDGTNTILKLHTTTLSKYNGSTWDSISTGFTNNSTDKAIFANAFVDNADRVYIASMLNDNLAHYDGSTFGTITDTKAKHVEFYDSSLYIGNAKIGVTTYPNRVYFSTVGTDDFNTSESYFDVDEPVMGLKTYANKLHVFTENYVSAWDGYSLVQIPGNFGTTSGRSIQVVDGKMIWYNRDGVYMYAGAGLPIVISRKVDNIFKLVPNPYLVSSGVDEKGRYVIYLGDITYKGVAYSDMALTYDVINNNWTLRPNSPFACMTTLKTGGVTKLYAGDVDNDKVWYVNGSQSLNGSTLASELQTKKFDANRPHDEKNFWKLFVTFKPTGASEYLTIKYRLDGTSAWSQIGGTNNNVDLSGTDLIETAELDLPPNTQGKLIQFQITHSSVTGGFEVYELRLECDMLRS